MVREERTIEVTLISATDLKKVKKFGREQKNYVSAYIYPARRQTTGADPYGGVNPTWNRTLKLTCYESDLHAAAATTSDRTAADSSSSAPSAHEMTLEIYSHGGGLFHTADKLVGTVTVPLQQVASAAQAGGAMPAFDVHLPTESSGQVQGSLNLSVKLGAKRELGDYEDLTAAPLPSYSDQGGASSIYPPATDKAPSTQTGGYSSRGQSSYGNYPPISGHASPAPNQNTSHATGEDTVTGYPAPGYYAFAPLGQLQSRDQPPPEISAQRPYVVYSPEGARHQTRRERKRERKRERRERKRERRERKRERRQQKRAASAGMVGKLKARGVGMIAILFFPWV